MKIKQIIMRHMKMRMRRPFTTSVGTEYDKEFIIVEAKSEDGLIGWGESVAAIDPFYKEETVQTNWHILEKFLIPLVFAKPINHPDELNNERFSHIRGNYMAKAAIEEAIWDLYARQQNLSLAQALGGEKKKIEVGISIGIEESVEELIGLVDQYVKEGYKRIKVKIQPGWDVEVIRAVRERFPDIALMGDANSAYTLADTALLQQLDEFNLTMIEQPLAHDDIIDHAELQAQLKTPICLDESIHSAEDVRKAIKLGSCGIINIKIGRVGGLTEAKKIHDLCQKHDMPVWCGGMLEAGIGRAHNVAITTLTNFILPGDTAASSRYWEEDIITPEVTVEDGWITVPQAPGIGYEPDRERMDRFTLYSQSYFS
ncbi:o-succinylbenzoate synthase [Aneurinibacillus sp. REN35]|uniref:o-succinylbenzoate synthase n=1 Tax=Aneurinibacillus sp. REN35 TaxID=3237286 RepID=UPI003526D943